MVLFFEYANFALNKIVLVNVTNLMDEKGNWINEEKHWKYQNNFHDLIQNNNKTTVWEHASTSMIFTDINSMKKKYLEVIDFIFNMKFPIEKYSEEYRNKMYIKYQKRKDKVLGLTEKYILTHELDTILY